MFPHRLELGQNTDAALAALPTQRGVFAIYGSTPEAEPYISHTANLRRRLQRLLGAEDGGTKRLNLRQRAVRLEYAATGSALESLLLLYRAHRDPRQRLKLRPPPLLRCAIENAYPRVYVTTRLSLKAAQHFYGPFASRVQAESYLESVLDLFLLRRCQPDLAPDPAFPGCIYSEMHKCLAPCFKGCSDDRYRIETEAVCAFLDSRGESLKQQYGDGRDAASAALDFERAAELHAKFERARAAAHLAPELARPVSQIHAVIVERSAADQDAEESVTLYLFTRMRFFGPVPFSTFGMRHGNEQSTSSSLFVQPVQLAPVPLDEPAELGRQTERTSVGTTLSLDQRLGSAVQTLLNSAEAASQASSAVAMDHLALLRRWFYRPESQRTGEIFFAASASEPDAQLSPAAFPLRRMLRGISRVVTGQSASQATALQSESLPAT